MIIVFEGPDGCGKTTMIQKVKKAFDSNKELLNTQVDTLHMPIREHSRFIGTHLKEGGLVYEAQLESLLQQRDIFSSGHNYHNAIRSENYHTLISRWFPSTFVYGVLDFSPMIGREQSMKLLSAMGKFSNVPDLGIIIMPENPKILIDRIKSRECESEPKDIYEKKEETIYAAYELYKHLVDDIQSGNSKYDFCKNYIVYSGDFSKISIQEMTYTCVDMIIVKLIEIIENNIMKRI